MLAIKFQCRLALRNIEPEIKINALAELLSYKLSGFFASCRPVFLNGNQALLNQSNFKL